MADETRTLTAVEATQGDASATLETGPVERPEGEQAVGEALGGLRGLLELDYTDTKIDPNRYRVRKLKGRDLKRVREIALGALDKIAEMRKEAERVYAENEPARVQVNEVARENRERIERNQKIADGQVEGEPLPMLPVPDVTFIPEPDTGIQIGRYILSDVLDELLLDDSSWLASLLEEGQEPDDLDLDWYLCVIEKVMERDDFPNLLARHLRIYQVFSNALRTKSQ